MCILAAHKHSKVVSSVQVWMCVCAWLHALPMMAQAFQWNPQNTKVLENKEFQDLAAKKHLDSLERLTVDQTF